MGILGMITGGLGAVTGIANAVKGAGRALGIGKSDEERQYDQQKKLQGLQIQGSKELADYSQQKQMENIGKSTEAQMEAYKKNGLNPALMYGGAGAGGTTGNASMSLPSTATATDTTAAKGMGIQEALMGAQLGLMQAQTRKLNVDANKTEGADTEATKQGTAEGAERTNLLKFQNAINKVIGVENDVDVRKWEHDLKGIEFQKENGMWESFKATGFQKGNYTDSDNIVNKALKAGWEKTITDLANAKKQGNIMDATTTIEQFKAGLAKAGIAPDSPWFVKILGDMLEKVGLNPLDTAKGVLKKM